jgi:hypothetical protein
MSVLSLKSNSSLTARTIQVAEATTPATSAAVKLTRATDVERSFETVAAALTVITTATTNLENKIETTATTAFK